MVAIVESCDVSSAGGEQAVRARGGKAGENREAKRSAHHERGIDDPRGQTGVALRDIIQSGQQQRIERDTPAQSEQNHAWENIHHEISAERGACEKRESDSRQEQSYHQRALDAKACHKPGGEAERKNRHDQVRWQKSQANLQWAISKDQ